MHDTIDADTDERAARWPFRSRDQPASTTRSTPRATGCWRARHAAGFWCGELEGDTTLESYLILLEAFLGRRDSEKSRRLARTIRDRGAAGRRLEPVPGRPRRPVGLVPQLLRAEGRGRRRGRAAHARARARSILRAGRRGAGQHVHAVPPGAVRAVPVGGVPGDPARDDLPARPRRRSASTTCRAGRGRSSSRCRSSGRRSRCARCPPARGVARAVSRRARQRSPAPRAGAGLGDALLRRRPRCSSSASGCPAPRRCARRAVAARGGLDDRRGSRTPTACRAILPAMSNAALALSCLGHGEDHPLLREALGRLDGLLLRRRRTARCACSPACRRSGTRCSPATRWRRRALPDGDPALRAGGSPGCSAKQTTRAGRLGAAQPGAAGRLVLRAPQRALPRRRRHLHGADGAAPARAPTAPRRRRRRPSSAASPGCWGCRTATAAGPASIAATTRHWLTQVPFADHNAMIDPSTADITGRVLECLEPLPRLRPRAIRWSRRALAVPAPRPDARRLPGTAAGA